MAPAAKVSEFRKEGNDWFCNGGLPSDITLVVDSVNFYLHRFPLVFKCGKIAKICDESGSTNLKALTAVLEEFPGGSSAFLIAAKFCYGVRVEFTPRNVVSVFCAADYLEMTEEYGEGNLVSQSDDFLHKQVLRNWKDSILALQSCESVLAQAEKLHIVSKCMNALSMMVCTDPSLFGWPMMMYGTLQSPGGSILWNGINTGARIRSSESDWWFEDISHLSVGLFEKVIRRMESRGIRPEQLAGAVMYYTRKYVPGISRWQRDKSGKSRSVASFSSTPPSVDQTALLETITKILPSKKGKSFCRFLLGLLRVGLILGVNRTCLDSLEKKIGMQLELATLESLLIPTYSDSDTLYETDCVARIIHHFLISGSVLMSFSPPLLGDETSPMLEPLRTVAKLIDSYIAEVASDVNLKPRKVRSLLEALPESSRTLHDGLYRALDIFFKAHPWLPEKEKEELCNIIDYSKLSIDACTHASQNERLPLRAVFKVLFFEHMHLRTAIANCFQVVDAEIPPAADLRNQLVQRGEWVNVVRQNQVLKVDFENTRSRVQELEQEFSKIKQEMKRVSKSPRSLSSLALGCKRLTQTDNSESNASTPRPSHEQPRASHHTRRPSQEQLRESHHSRHRKSPSLF